MVVLAATGGQIRVSSMTIRMGTQAVMDRQEETGAMVVAAATAVQERWPSQDHPSRSTTGGCSKEAPEDAAVPEGMGVAAVQAALEERGKPASHWKETTLSQMMVAVGAMGLGVATVERAAEEVMEERAQMQSMAPRIN
jgi:hypothetical protein